MNGRGVSRVGERGAEVLRRRLAAIVARVAGVIGGIAALGGCAIVAVLGDGPGLLALLLIVLGSALVCGLLARALVMRIDPASLAAGLARRVGRR